MRARSTDVARGRPSTPLLSTLTRVVVPLTRSCTKMSDASFASLAIRFDDSDWNAM